MAGNVSAADEVIYVKEGGTGDGSSAGNALGSFTDAINAAAAKTADVTIKLVGVVNLDATDSALFPSNYFHEPAHSNKITWTGNDATSKLVVKVGSSTRCYAMHGELAIKDLAIELDGTKNMTIVTGLNDITIDTGVTMSNASTPLETINIYGATEAYFENSFYNATTKVYTVDPTITVKSGKVKQIVGFIGNSSTRKKELTLDGKVTINISGSTTEVYQVYPVANAYNIVKDCDITLDGGIVTKFVGATDRKYTGIVTNGPSGVTGTFNVYLTKNFNLSAQTALVGSAASGEFMSAICGSTANKTHSGSLSDAGLGTYILKADAEIYDAVNAEATKINKESFDSIVKVGGADDTTTGAPDTTTGAPDTTTQAPDTTTQAPDTTTQAPDTTTQAPDTNAPAEPTVPSKVIYVKDGGTGDGSSEDKAMGSLLDAVKEAAKKTDDVVIKFIGTVTLDGTKFASSYNYEPARTNKITWEGNDASAKLVIKTGTAARYYVLSGALAIRDLAVEIEGSKVLCLVTHLYDLTVDTGVSIKNPTNASETISVYGALKTTYDKTPFYNKETKEHTVNPTITIKSGSFKQIVGYIGNASTELTAAKLEGGKTVVLNGKLTINISGKDTYIYQLYPVCNTYNTVKDCDITLDGGIIGRFVGATDRKYTAGIVKYGPSGVSGTYTLYLTKNFDLSAQSALVGDDENTKNEFMLALCGSTANKNFAGSLDDKGLGVYVLKADAEIFDAIKAETVKINKATFDKVIKVTVAAGGGNGDNANTGDSTIVFAVLACVSLAAVVVISKKKRATR